MKCKWVIVLTLVSVFWQGSSWAGLAHSASLADLKVGTRIHTTRAIDIPVPFLLRDLVQSESLQLDEAGVVPVMIRRGSAGAACLLTDQELGFGDSNSLKLAKGAEFTVKSVELGKKVSPVFFGPAVVVKVESARTVGNKMKGTFCCYPGKLGSQASSVPISIATFEGLFRGGIEIDGLGKQP